MLGLSLATKHVLIFLPIWLFMRQDGWRRRVVYGLVPGVLFCASFLPWIYDGWWGIYDNVISYRSFSNAPLVNALTLGSLDAGALATIGSAVFILGMVAIGWASRRLPAITAVMVMLVALVVLAPGMANQYLAIPVAAMAVAPNVWFSAFTVGGTLLLIGDPDGLGVESLVVPMFDRDVVGRAHIYDTLILVLAVAGLQWWRRARATSTRVVVDAEVAPVTG